ncbi:MAG: hypothetical protein Kow00124_14470 [Anaerolineae bacterium]
MNVMPKPKILVAEDEADIRDLIMFTLEFEGFEVHTVQNGAEAVERAPELQPDLILLDVRMPRMTGYEACQKLKADPRTADIPIVFISAKGQETEVRAGLEAGAKDYILKPFSHDILLYRIRQHLAAGSRAGESKAAEAAEPPAPETKPAAEAPAASPEKAPAEGASPAPTAPDSPRPEASPPASGKTDDDNH